MSEGKHYYAFISHSSENEKIALWLRDQLDNYHIPVAVQKQYGVPKNLCPNFTFQTDLAGNKLKEVLDRELDDSKFLIVICSPSAAKSPYVNGEIQHFIDTGRTDKIIPFIIDGTPHASNPDEECFPPALRSLSGDNELRGINLKESEKHLGSKMAAVVNVIATMLGIRFDVLWDKYRRRRIRQRSILAIIALLLLATGLFIWDYTRPTYRYYVDYVDQWGVPQGVVELDKEQVSQRNSSYRFEYRRTPFGEPNAYSWRVAKVSHVNAALCPQEISSSELRDRYPIQEIEYNKTTGDVQRINYCDTKGKVLLRHELSEREGVPASIADFRNSQEQLGSGFSGASLTSMSLGQMDASQQKSSIVRYAYERDANGHIIRQTYHANNDYNLQRSAVSDADGIFGCLYTLDSLGRRTKIEYLGLNGEKACTKKGVAGRSLKYDTHGNITKATYFDLEGQTVYNEQMWASRIDVYDENGNTIEVSFHGPDGTLCQNLINVAIFKAKYDSHGNLLETTYYGTDSLPCLSKECIAKVVYTCNDKGYETDLTCLGTDGNLICSSYGFARRATSYDKNGNLIEEAYFGTDGKPCLSKNGYAQWVAKYDERGNIVETAYFGTDGKPCFSQEHIAKVTYQYDKQGNRVEVACFGTDGTPCLNNFGYFKRTSKYDDRGNLSETAYFGTDGKPCLNDDMIAKWTAKYDDCGNLVETANFGIDGKPCADNTNVYRTASKYDSHGNLTEQAYYGTNDSLCFVHSKGIAMITNTFDEKGNCTEWSYWDTDQKPCLDNEGVHHWVCRYDSRGNRIEEAYYGTDNEPCLNIHGAHKGITTYDSQGNVIRAEAFDTDGNPCLTSYGFFKMEKQYDSRGNQIEETYFGIDGKPCPTNVGPSKVTSRYDDKGNCTEVAYFGIDGLPCLNNEGIAKASRVYDEKGLLTEVSFWGVDGKPCISKYGYARWTKKYNDRGKTVETAHYDTDGNLCLNTNGYAINRIKYDQRGSQVESLYLGPDSLPIAPYGYHRQTATYNEFGENTMMSYFDTNDNPLGDYYYAMYVNNISGFALNQGIQIGYIVIQYNNWIIGDSREKAQKQISRSVEKHCYFLTPEGTITYLHKEAGLLGISLYDMTIEKSQADEWIALLEEWKKNNPTK